jgi:hypothetical protein
MIIIGIILYILLIIWTGIKFEEQECAGCNAGLTWTLSILFCPLILIYKFVSIFVIKKWK